MIQLAEQERPKRTPYTTPSGLQIGSRYEPHPINPHTKEDDFWQGVLLGDPPRWTIPRIISMVVHIAASAILISIAIHFGV